MIGIFLFTARAGVDQSSKVRKMKRVFMLRKIVPNLSSIISRSSPSHSSGLWPTTLVTKMAETKMRRRKSTPIHPTLWVDSIRPLAS
jgi:hypothetical protein